MIEEKTQGPGPHWHFASPEEMLATQLVDALEMELSFSFWEDPLLIAGEEKYNIKQQLYIKRKKWKKC